MSDIDGMDAFNQVLDRLVEAEKRAANLAIDKMAADTDRRNAQVEVAGLKERNAQLAADLANEKAKLQKLEKAAAEVVAAVKGIPVSKADAKMAAAVKKMDDLIDDIPF